MSISIDFNANRTKFNCIIKSDFTKVYDKSGKGKTFLCESLKSALNTWKDTGVYPVKDTDTNKNIRVKILNGIDNFLSDELKDANTLYIIDEADAYLMNHPESVDIILNNESSKFIFMLRAGIKGLKFDYNEKAFMTYNEETKTIGIQYYT